VHAADEIAQNVGPELSLSRIASPISFRGAINNQPRSQEDTRLNSFRTVTSESQTSVSRSKTTPGMPKPEVEIPRGYKVTQSPDQNSEVAGQTNKPAHVAPGGGKPMSRINPATAKDWRCRYCGRLLGRHDGEWLEIQYKELSCRTRDREFFETCPLCRQENELSENKETV